MIKAENGASLEMGPMGVYLELHHYGGHGY